MSFAREKDFEDALVRLLVEKYGWRDGVLNHPTEEDLLTNWAKILWQHNRESTRLGNYPPTAGEMQQLMEQIAGLRTPLRLNEFINGKTASIRRENTEDAAHLGKEVSLFIYDRMHIASGESTYQIARQPVLRTPHPLASDRRGDLMLLINGMPVIHIELKRSGVAVGQATNQIEKYMREGAFGGLFRMLQVFVGMTPEETVYFANPGAEGRFNREYYFHWADFNNRRVNDWQEVARQLLSIPMAHELIGYYTVADAADGVLKVLRSYQLYAARAIFNKVRRNEEWEGGRARLGGYVWHTTGSGKTLTCFKAAQMIAETQSADKVVFLLDRKELGTQSLNAYRGFAGNHIEVQATENTAVLAARLRSDLTDDALIVTSIQKMSRIREEAGGIGTDDLEKMRGKKIVFIVDEAHRDVNGEMLLTVKRTFPEAMFFGFTGTPILRGSDDERTTANVFGDELHRYTLADGIRDQNVLGFAPTMELTYEDSAVRKVVALEKARAKSEAEALADSDKRAEYLKWMNPAQKTMVQIEAELPRSQYDCRGHREKVVESIGKNWLTQSVGGNFHALLATSSIAEAIAYYRLLKEKLPELKTAALFDPGIDNDDPDANIDREKAMLEILEDYNGRYGMHFSVSGWDQFKKDVADRLAHKRAYRGIEREDGRARRLDLLIVVDQMLTGFDSKWINTLHLDKMREGGNLIQAFSRTNRLAGPEKPFGAVRYYRKPHTMTKNIDEALETYAGDKPYALYVDHLETNVNGMNQKFTEIRALFDGEGIRDFERLPDEESLRGRFALLFKEFHKYLYAAKLQGFTWGQSIYTFKHEDGGSTMVTMALDERVYGILLLRYRELANGGPGGGAVSDVPFDIEPHLTEIDIGLVNAEYLNRKFHQYVRSLQQGNATPEERERLLSDLHGSFAGLSQEDQSFARLLLDDINAGNVTLEPDRTLQDYIAQYKTAARNRDIDTAVRAFGLARDALVEILQGGRVTEENLNEFGRFDRLLRSVDRSRAKVYLETALGRPLDPIAYRTTLTRVLKEFILSGGKADRLPRSDAGRK